jgi:hypothetical protein
MRGAVAGFLLVALMARAARHLGSASTIVAAAPERQALDPACAAVLVRRLHDLGIRARRSARGTC